MAIFVIELIVFLSLSSLLYIVGVALPRIDGKPVRVSRGTHWVLDRIEQVDVLINAFLEKTLRRIKVTTLKFDNTVSKQLEQFKKENRDDNSSNLN